MLPQDEYYKFDELIVLLESIKENGSGDLNFPKAIYSLAMEILKLKNAYTDRQDTVTCLWCDKIEKEQPFQKVSTMKRKDVYFCPRCFEAYNLDVR